MSGTLLFLKPSPFGVGWDTAHLFPGLPKLNPGLELANTFGVGFCNLWMIFLSLIRLANLPFALCNHLVA
jgi:hypothetical protein